MQIKKGKNVDQNKRTMFVFYNYFPLIYIMSRAEGQLELGLMRGYEIQFRERVNKKVVLSYDCLPLNVEEYNLRVSQVLEEMKLTDPNEKDLNLHDEIILGRIEGQLGSSNFKQIIESVVGEVSEEKIKLYLKQKTQQRTFGLNGKDKMSIVRQVKKIQPLKKYFNIQHINKKRKFNKLYSSALKNLAKYLELYDKIDPANVESIKTAFEQYTNYSKEDKKFKNYLKQLQATQLTNIAEKPSIIQENIAVNEAENPPLIVQQQKIDQQAKIATQTHPKQSPSKNDKKSSEQKQNKTAKKSQKAKSKVSKPQQNHGQQANSGQVTEKEKVQAEDRAQKEKAQKAKQQKQKTVKKPITNNKAITDFFSIKKKENTQQQSLLQFKTVIGQDGQNQNDNLILSNNQAPIQNIGVKNSVWQKFSLKGQKLTVQKQQIVNEQEAGMSMSELRSQFRCLKMQSQQYNPQPYYTNIIMTLSTLQYFNYFMQPTPLEINFSKPFSRIGDVFYFEDESQQFEGQSADEDQQQEEMQEGSMMSDNNTILSDDHLSNQELSSCDPNQFELKVEYGKANKWIFGQANNKIQSEQQFMYIVNRFQILCLQDAIPLPLEQQQDNSDKIVITTEMWRDVYKLAHGYYGTKEAIIKDISIILPGVSKTWIDTMLKQRTQKIINQRFIKLQFVQEIKQRVPDIEDILANVLDQRNQGLRRQKAEKNFQKDQKLQKDILQCTGSRYIVNLLKQLKQKGYKQLRRNQLIEFINERRGEEWEKIKVQINTMSRPIVEMIKGMNNGQDRIDEEVVVEDQEYNNNNQGQNDNLVINNNVEEKAQNQKKTKKSQKLKEKQQKLKMKKRKQKNISGLQSIYEKTKPISRARKTKNSLKTGIPSIDELKKQKLQERNQNEEQQVQNHQQREQVENAQVGQNKQMNENEYENQKEVQQLEEDCEEQQQGQLSEDLIGQDQQEDQNVQKKSQNEQENNKVPIEQKQQQGKQGIKNESSDSINPSKSTQTVLVPEEYN